MKKKLEKLFQILPFTKYIFLLIRFFYNILLLIYQNLYFFDEFNVKVDGRKFRIRHGGLLIENEILWKGLLNAWEKVSMSLWVKLSKNSNCVFDIGANTGIYALVAQTQNRDAKIFAFEPVVRVFERLKHNCEINNYDINCQKTALSDFEGTASIWDVPGSKHTLSVTVNKNTAGSGKNVKEVKIATTTLASFIEKYNIPKIDLMKIDVETHEVEVLKGMGKYLDTMRPAMLIEIVSDENGKLVEEMIQGMGYLYFNIDEKNPPRRVDHILQSDKYNYLLCSEAQARVLRLI